MRKKAIMTAAAAAVCLSLTGCGVPDPGSSPGVEFIRTILDRARQAAEEGAYDGDETPDGPLQYDEEFDVTEELTEGQEFGGLSPE